VVVLLLGVLFAAASCGSDDGGETAPPLSGGPVYASGELSDVPLPAGASESQAPAEADGAIAAAYVVPELPPVEVVSRMGTLLADARWEELEPFTEAGERVFRGEFAREGRRLEVMVVVVPDATTEGAVVSGVQVPGSEIGLVLHPDLTGAPDNTVPPLTVPEQGEGVDGTTG
jgi:hypothetical protein